MSPVCIARLAHSFDQPRLGTVHSVFSRVVNVGFDTCEGRRLLTFVTAETPCMPDSVCVPESLLEMLQLQDKLTMDRDTFSVHGETYQIKQDELWDGRIKPRNKMPNLTPFIHATRQLTSGFDRLPQDVRARADASLQSGDFEACLGLGFGLTPSFDDACIGAMAVSYMVAEPVPPIADLSMTTDVSAHYLRLATMGFFGQTLVDIIEALFVPNKLEKSIQALKTVGATSGSDMLYGVRMKIRKYYYNMI